MNAIAAHLEKLKDYIFILLVTGLYTVVANTFGYNGDLAQGRRGHPRHRRDRLLRRRDPDAARLQQAPRRLLGLAHRRHRLDPELPRRRVDRRADKHINFLATTTPILAYGGLCLGKDLEAFKRLSWRIVPVAMAVASGSFLCATALAELMLHLEASSDPRSDNRSTMDRMPAAPAGAGAPGPVNHQI